MRDFAEMSDNRHQRTSGFSGLRSDPGRSVASHAIRILAADNNSAQTRLEKLIRKVMRAAQNGFRMNEMADVQSVLGDIIDFEQMIDVVIPEAARRFGELWVADEISFAEVSIASARLQALVRLAMDHLSIDERRTTDAPIVLVVVSECEPHTLGSVILSSWLTRHGISHELIIGQSFKDVERIVSSEKFDGIFLSVATSALLNEVRNLIARLKDFTPKVPIIVGGPAVEYCRAELEDTGADVVTSDPQYAMEYLGIRIPATQELEKI